MRAILRRWAEQDAGLSLTELLVALSLTVVVMAAGWALMYTGTVLADTTDARQQATDESRNVLAALTTELRQAVEITEDAGAFASALPRSCEFYSDIDHDGLPELVRYRVVQRELRRSIAQPTTLVPPFVYGAYSSEEVMANGLPSSWTGNVFTYYDGGNPPAEKHNGSKAEISAVQINLKNSKSVGARSAQVDLSTLVKIRSIHNSID